MTSVAPVAVPLSGAESSAPKPQNETEALKSFEGVFLSQMVEEMVKTIDLGEGMGEHAAEMWRSVISQALADGLVESGGLGIAQNIQNNINSYKAQLGGVNE